MNETLFQSTAPPPVILRDYQQKTYENVIEALGEHRSTLVVLPTGTGKTIVAAKVIEHFSQQGRCLVLVHRQELMRQAVEKITEVTGLECDVEMGNQWADKSRFTRAPVVVSSVQTMVAGEGGAGRMTRFDRARFVFLWVDEAHHATAKSWRKVIEYFMGNLRIKLLGVTATPDRTDEEALGKVFASVAMVYELQDAISDGWLVPLQISSVYIDTLDFAAIKTTAGDLNGGELAAVMEYENNLHEIASPTIEISNGRRTLVFAASVAHAERLSEIFNRHKDGCSRWVHGGTPQRERETIFKDYRSGEYQILVNVGIVTEGVDVPDIEVVAMARPTKSRSLYSQMLGRGTRPLPGIVDGPETPGARVAAIQDSAKKHLHIIDFVGNAGSHKLINPIDILGGNYDDDVVARAKAEAVKSGTPGDVMEQLELASALVMAERKKQEHKRRAGIKGKAGYSTRTIDPFAIFDLEPQRERGWDKSRQLSDKQRGLLERQGIDPNSMTYTESKQIIGELFKRWNGGLATLKQCKILRQHGFDIKGVNKKQATKVIDAIAGNSWKPLSQQQRADVMKSAKGEA